MPTPPSQNDNGGPPPATRRSKPAISINHPGITQALKAPRSTIATGPFSRVVAELRCSGEYQ